MKKKIEKVFVGVCAMVFLISACLLDSEGWLPFYLCLVSGAGLSGYAYGKGWIDIGRRRKNEDHKTIGRIHHADRW